MSICHAYPTSWSMYNPGSRNLGKTLFLLEFLPINMFLSSKMRCFGLFRIFIGSICLMKKSKWKNFFSKITISRPFGYDHYAILCNGTEHLFYGGKAFIMRCIDVARAFLLSCISGCRAFSTKSCNRFHLWQGWGTHLHRSELFLWW